jgi:hypothetical protein
LAGGGVPDAGFDGVAVGAGLVVFGFFFLTGFSGSVSSITIFLGGGGGAACAAAKAVLKRTNSASLLAARF